MRARPNPGFKATLARYNATVVNLSQAVSRLHAMASLMQRRHDEQHQLFRDALSLVRIREQLSILRSGEAEKRPRGEYGDGKTNWRRTRKPRGRGERHERLRRI
jgi:hypothetical protein